MIETSRDLKFSQRKSNFGILLKVNKMGYAKKVEDDNNSSSSSLNESLLIATMCIIGLNVHVHLKDGSVFSGIFYTASVDTGFGTFHFIDQFVSIGFEMFDPFAISIFSIVMCFYIML